MNDLVCLTIFVLAVGLSAGAELQKEEVDKVIEDEITSKLRDDLLQSLERKFQVDLQKSVDTVLRKIKLLLNNGTMQIQERLSELQDMMELIKGHGAKELDQCLLNRQNVTTALAEKALHQMVVCGYALIGHDPSHAVHTVVELKEMIRQGVQPIHAQKNELYSLLKACGHDHDSLKKVIKCVISKSPVVKSAMMDITSKLIEGVVGLTKQMAHGAMHEACLIEVIKQIEDEAFLIVEDVRKCVFLNDTYENDLQKYVKENNATVIDAKKDVTNKSYDVSMTDVIRRMLAGKKKNGLDGKFKDNLTKMQSDLNNVDANELDNNNKKD